MSSEKGTNTEAAPTAASENPGGFAAWHFLVLSDGPEGKKIRGQGQIIGLYEGLHVAEFITPAGPFTRVIPVEEIHHYTFFRSEDVMSNFVALWFGHGPTVPGHEPNEDPREVDATVDGEGRLEVTVHENEKEPGC